MSETITIYFLDPVGNPGQVEGTPDHVVKLIQLNYVIITKGDYETAVARRRAALRWLDSVRKSDHSDSPTFEDYFRE